MKSFSLMVVIGGLAWSVACFGFGKKGTFPPLPEDFKWCAATAAHCIEGDNHLNDFWDWEHLPPICDRSGCYCTTNGCAKSGRATDHWNRVPEDTALLKKLGLNQYRMSIEWSRIEPSEGVFDPQAIRAYRVELQQLVDAGIEPFVTLQHFTVPRWFRTRGGWVWEGAPSAFARFARLAYEEYGDLVSRWVTINEPFVHLGGGYVLGLTPPSLPFPKPFKPSNGDENDYFKGATPTAEDFKRVLEPARGLLRAHAQAYRAMHAAALGAGRKVEIGLAHHLRVFDAKRAWNPGDQLLAGVLDQLWNWTFSDAVKTGILKISIPLLFSHKEAIPEIMGTEDFFGLNFYTRDQVALSLGKGLKPQASLTFKPNTERTMLGWEVYPEGLYRTLESASKRHPGMPIYITENGIATLDEAQRQAYIRRHVQMVQKAHSQGVNVKGYCHFTFMDDFELGDGYFPKFGLYHTDFGDDFRRTEKSSVDYYRKTILNRGSLSY